VLLRAGITLNRYYLDPCRPEQREGSAVPLRAE